jgi:hypothetical protein
LTGKILNIISSKFGDIYHRFVVDLNHFLEMIWQTFLKSISGLDSETSAREDKTLFSIFVTLFG